MADAGRETWITGIGMLSSLGEGLEAHWQAFVERRTRTDAHKLAPYVVHPLMPIDFDKQIAKKGDQRQMEPWQRIGTYTAGLALDQAKLKGNAELLGRTDMIVAAGGGERDIAADSAILTGLAKAGDPAAYLNERLMSDIRPTLFLAQLSNLLAGNISIVHGVTGSSRTFMGEEAAGFDAVRIALARIAAGQSDLALVGGGFNAEREDAIMVFEFGGYNLKGDFKSVWQRAPQGGFALGSLGAFLVLEHRAHAEARGATPVARLTSAASERSNRKPGAVTAALGRMWDRVASRLDTGHHAIISGATGVEPATTEERAFAAEHTGVPVRAIGNLTGHGLESQFVMGIAAAALAVSHRTLFPPTDCSGVERPMDGALTQAVVTGVGHWQGEGMALVEAVR
jgi:3-oxoacyl-[acyl-carrier-protein] synthase II